MIDVHSHILPEIDDGSQDMKESIQMIKEAYEAGFTDIVSTSHYIEESYNVEKKEREKLIEIIKEELRKENINVKIYNGAEAYISSNLGELIQGEILPTINHTKYLLMELPRHSEIIYLDNMISELIDQGIIPIIAHPERYTYVQKKPKALLDLIEKGVLFQANYGSIIGNYGNEAKKTIKKLLKNNMIHLLGTDSHRKNSIYVQMPIILKKLERLIGKAKLEELCDINPRIVLEGKDLS